MKKLLLMTLIASMVASLGSLQASQPQSQRSYFWPAIAAVGGLTASGWAVKPMWDRHREMKKVDTAIDGFKQMAEYQGFDTSGSNEEENELRHEFKNAAVYAYNVQNRNDFRSKNPYTTVGIGLAGLGFAAWGFKSLYDIFSGK